MSVYADTSGCCVSIATQQPDVWYRHIPVCTAYKVAPDDGLIYSETCRASNRKLILIQRILLHLVCLYTYCRMMHGAYKVKCVTVREVNSSQSKNKLL